VLAIKDFLTTGVGSHIFRSTWTLCLLVSRPYAYYYFKHYNTNIFDSY